MSFTENFIEPHEFDPKCLRLGELKSVVTKIGGKDTMVGYSIPLEYRYSNGNYGRLSVMFPKSMCFGINSMTNENGTVNYSISYWVTSSYSIDNPTPTEQALIDAVTNIRNRCWEELNNNYEAKYNSLKLVKFNKTKPGTKEYESNKEEYMKDIIAPNVAPDGKKYSSKVNVKLFAKNGVFSTMFYDLNTQDPLENDAVTQFVSNPVKGSAKMCEVVMLVNFGDLYFGKSMSKIVFRVNTNEVYMNTLSSTRKPLLSKYVAKIVEDTRKDDISNDDGAYTNGYGDDYGGDDDDAPVTVQRDALDDSDDDDDDVQVALSAPIPKPKAKAKRARA